MRHITPLFLSYLLLLPAYSALAQSPGDFVITEFMADPADVNDNQGEYVEIYNVSNMTIDINGCQITDGTGATPAIVSGTLNVPKGGLVVFGKPSVPGRDVEYGAGSFGLNNNGDDIIFECPDGMGGFVTIASLAYTSSITGTSYELNDYTNHVNGTTSFSDYVPSTTTLNYDADADTDLGSPGTAGNTILPIELVDFRGSRNGSSILLEWITATEINNDFMAIERSADGRIFSEIGSIRGAGTTTEAQHYRFTDRRPLAGTNYYRLRQVDFDGTAHYHRIIAIEADARTPISGSSLYPSISKGALWISISGTSVGNIPFEIFDLSGRRVRSGFLQGASALQELRVDELPRGSYYFRLMQGQTSHIYRFLRQ